MPKVIVFVIDISGSMFGHKMEQLKRAVTSIMRGLNKDVRNGSVVPFVVIYVQSNQCTVIL